MKPTPAIVQQAVDLAAIVNEWDLLDSREQRTIAEIKAGKTRLLISARSAFNSRGDGFKAFVEGKLRIPFRTALRWMTDAGYTPPKKEGAGGDHGQSGHDDHESDGDDDGDSDSKSENGKATKKPKPEPDVDDPEQYRIAYLIRAEQAVQFADMTIPLLREFYALKPRRKKDHKELIDWARRAADAWTKLANELESE